MEPNLSQKGINNSMFFVDGFPDSSGNIGGTASVAASVTLSRADPLGRRHIIKEYCTTTSKDRIACRIWHALGRWPGELSAPYGAQPFVRGSYPFWSKSN